MKPVLNKSTETHGVAGIQSFTVNLLPKLVRQDSMEGRDFIVVPMIILTEGVHVGSDGPLFYPKEELSKTPVVWNYKPVVVYHPEMNGVGVSACDPAILTSRKVGVMMNTRFEKGKLKSEAWIEKDRVNAIDPRILEAVEKSEMMELSTGVFVDCEAEEGEWCGEEYTGIARNLRPDHLALLPDQIGACSIADGAGFMRNQGAGPVGNDADYLVTEPDGTTHLRVKRGGTPDHNLMGAAWAALHGGYRGNKYQGPNKTAALRKLKALYKSEQMSMPGVTDNEMSFDNIRQELGRQLRERLAPADSGTMTPGPWIQSIYSNFIVYEWQDKLYRLAYTQAELGVQLSDETPVEVIQVTEYRSLDGQFVGNETQQTNEPMDKTKKVDAILANASKIKDAPWSEKDRVALTALSEPQLEAIEKSLTQNTVPAAAPGTPAAPSGQPAPAAPATTPPASAALPASPVGNVAPATPKVISLEDYIAAAPGEMQDVLRNGVSIHNQEKQRLIDLIVANKNNEFPKEELEHRPLGELRRLARLVGGDTPAPDYSGQGATPLGNASEEALVMPVLNFGKETAKA